MLLNISGNLGVGTSDPSERLQINNFVEGLNKSYIKIATAGENTGTAGDRSSGIKFRHFSDVWGMTIESYEGPNRPRGLYFKTNTNFAGENQALFISRDNGRIGIGGTDFSPESKLMVLDSENLGSNEKGAIKSYKNSSLLNQGSSIVGESNNSGDASPSTVYSIGKLGGFSQTPFGDVGVHGYATGSSAEDQFGVIGAVAGTGINDPAAWGTMGVRINNTSYAVYANGDQFSTTGAMWSTSDKRLKKNIQDLEKALDLLLQLRVHTFQYRKDGDFANLNTPENMQYGFIAQELETILPTLVREIALPLKPRSGESRMSSPSSIPIKAIQPLALIPILTRATQEQQAQIEANDSHTQRDIADLRAENQKLKDELTEIKSLLKALLEDDRLVQTGQMFLSK